MTCKWPEVKHKRQSRHIFPPSSMMQRDNLMIILLNSLISVLTFSKIKSVHVQNQCLNIKFGSLVLQKLGKWYPNWKRNVEIFTGLKYVDSVRDRMDQTQLAFNVILLLNDFYWVITTRLIWVKRNESNLSI